MSPVASRTGPACMGVGFAVLLLAAAGCVRPPLELQGQFPPVTVADAQATDRVGERVRWGGEIVETRPAEAETCLEVVSLPLDRQARPQRSDVTYGRFLACGPGFYDPALYAAKRRVTVVGILQEVETGKIGDRPYPFPLLRAEVVHLWPPPRPQPYYYYPYPYFGYYGYWGFWRPYYAPRAPRRWRRCD